VLVAYKEHKMSKVESIKSHINGIESLIDELDEEMMEDGIPLEAHTIEEGLTSDTSDCILCTYTNKTGAK
jgi:hypothetical protein